MTLNAGVFLVRWQKKILPKKYWKIIRTFLRIWGIRNMCDVIDHYLKIGEEKGVLIGFEKGRSEGELLGEAKTICAFYASGMSPEEIASRLKKDVAEVKAAIQKYSLT